MMYATLGGHFLLTQRWQMGIGQHGYAKFGWFARICGHICKRISSGKSTFEVMIWSQLKLKSNSPYLIWLPYMGWVAEGSSPMAWNATLKSSASLRSRRPCVLSFFFGTCHSHSQSHLQSARLKCPAFFLFPGLFLPCAMQVWNLRIDQSDLIYLSAIHGVKEGLVDVGCCGGSVLLGEKNTCGDFGHYL